MIATANDQGRRHGGWHRRRDRSRDVAMHEAATTLEAEARWLDDGGRAGEGRDVTLHDDDRPR